MSSKRKVLVFLVALLGGFSTVHGGPLEDGSNSQAANWAPERVIAIVLEADFRGADNGGERLDNVAYSSETEQEKFKGLGVRPGYYSLDWDSLEIVTEWRILASRFVSASLVEFDVEFNVVASTVGEGVRSSVHKGERRIHAITPPRKTRITYKLERHLGRWLVLDPAIPHVSLDAMIEYYTNKERFAAKKIGTMPSHHENLVAMRERALRQLTILTSIRDSL